MFKGKIKWHDIAYWQTWRIDRSLNWQKMPHMSPLWGICGEYFQRNWLCYNQTQLYNTTNNWAVKKMTLDDSLGTINTLRPRQNGHHFPGDIFKWIFLYENVWISIKISLKFVPNGPINNIPALVQIMIWCWLGTKPLSEPMMVRSLTHICITPPQWVDVVRISHFITLDMLEKKLLLQEDRTVSWYI